VGRTACSASPRPRTSSSTSCRPGWRCPLSVPDRELVPPGTQITLENCDREPIHVPGSIQPHGALLGYVDADSPIVVASSNTRDLLDADPDALLGSRLAAHFDEDSLAELAAFRQVGHASPLRLCTRSGRALDGLVHTSDGLQLLEVEPASDDISLSNSYHAIRDAVVRLNRTASVQELWDVAVEEIQRLTGFDRVMLYRFDRDWNGEIVAEACIETLEPFLGHHFPATDIPAQARALYVRNWLRFIRDVDARPAALTPAGNPLTGGPLDLSFSVLRSVSPIHLEYLRNMGVAASMSVSLVEGDRLVGLIACHHYAGPFAPPAAVRATCEFLGQTLSLLLSARRSTEQLARSVEAKSRLATAVAGLSRGPGTLREAVVDEAPRLCEMLGATGLAVSFGGDLIATYGRTPGDEEIAAIHRVVLGEHPSGAIAIDALGRLAPELESLAPIASGVLALLFDGDRYVLFFRPEVIQTIDWGGDPNEKPQVVGPDGIARLTPRGSFETWREVVHLRSRPWTELEIECADELRIALTEELLLRAAAMANVAAVLQRSLLPDTLPEVPGYRLAGDHRAASISVGGDWYDVAVLAENRVALVVGDVAGHNLAAAGAMAQLRNALRAYLFEGRPGADVLRRLDAYMTRSGVDVMCTVALALLDPGTGRVRLALAGHPPPLLRRADGQASVVQLEPNPPLGYGLLHLGPSLSTAELELAPGDTLVLVSDGLLERRDAPIDAGYARLLEHLGAASAPDALVEDVLRSAGPAPADDLTIVALAREA
jgi:serine phosphatase RsbU (regulator of sigma subunit)/GAF domain-containing protein